MLTKKEEKVLQFITREIAANGRAPTRAEICDKFDFKSRGTAEDYVRSLENKGHIIRDRSWGGIRLVGEIQRKHHTLPLFGRISAGKPIEAIANMDEIDVPGMLLGNGRYVLMVKGDSMINIGIHDGDYVIIKHTETAKSGDIVVALIDSEEATLKRLKKKRDSIELVPENSSMQPMSYDTERVRIQGILVGQFRTY